jgi:hypothetical protein
VLRHEANRQLSVFIYFFNEACNECGFKSKMVNSAEQLFIKNIDKKSGGKVQNK